MKDGTIRLQKQPKAQCRVVATGRAPAPRCGRAAGDPPQRQCVVCRLARPAVQLVQFKQQTADGAAGGRGAYVCINATCLTRAGSKIFGRALRVAAQADDPIAAVRALAEARLLELLGLARRCGELVMGSDAVLAAPWAAQPEFPCWLATDASDRTRRHIPWGRSFVSAAQLGRAVGAREVAALAVRPGRLALQAAYWSHVWYETDSRHGGCDRDAPSHTARDNQNTARDASHQLETD